MSLDWIRENPARWDADKARVVGGARAGVFDERYRALSLGALVPGEWWRLERDGKVIAFGWLDTVFGDAEILLMVDPAVRAEGVGTFVLDRLEDEARALGLNYIYNIVRPTHPSGAELSAWLEKRGFTKQDDGRLVRAAARPPRASVPPPGA